MSLKGKKIAVIGGDKRQAWVARILRENGYETEAWGVAELEDTRKLCEVLDAASLILCPVPFTRDRKNLFLTRGELSIRDFLSMLTETQILAGGCLSEAVLSCCGDHKITAYDYMESQSLTLYNAVATAEGAVAEAVLRSPVNLHGARVMVTGFGRCASVLADKLAGLSSHVTVCARSEEARMKAFVSGFTAVSMEEGLAGLGTFDYIFNTVPSLIIDENALKQVSPPALIIDIASAPGGVDYAAARRLGVNAALCLGLPGKYAPYSSAKAIVEEVLRHCINN